jgi:hypothetical protein
MSRLIAPLLATLLLGGCELFGSAAATAEKQAAQREAEGKAIGGACRHAARAIEDCFTLNRRADKAALFAGWREMNDYMRDNKIEPVAPTLAAQATGGAAPEPAASTKPAADTDRKARPRS